MVEISGERGGKQVVSSTQPSDWTNDKTIQDTREVARKCHSSSPQKCTCREADEVLHLSHNRSRDMVRAMVTGDWGSGIGTGQHDTE